MKSAQEGSAMLFALVNMSILTYCVGYMTNKAIERGVQLEQSTPPRDTFDEIRARLTEEFVTMEKMMVEMNTAIEAVETKRQALARHIAEAHSREEKERLVREDQQLTLYLQLLEENLLVFFEKIQAVLHSLDAISQGQWVAEPAEA